MKEYVKGRKVVIFGGRGNIEQAIFILKKDVREINEDYILDEAKKIVDEFVARSGLPGRKNIAKWVLISSAVLCFAVGIWVYMFM